MHLQALLCGHHVAQPSTSMGILKERGKQWHRAHEAKVYSTRSHIPLFIGTVEDSNRACFTFS